jgi:hypothetical protein
MLQTRVLKGVKEVRIRWYGDTLESEDTWERWGNFSDPIFQSMKDDLHEHTDASGDVHHQASGNFQVRPPKKVAVVMVVSPDCHPVSRRRVS